VDIRQLLRLAVERGASDLHLRAGAPPILRVDGTLISLDRGAQPLAHPEIQQALSELTSKEVERRFTAEKELDFPYSLEGVGRFRVNASIQRGTVALAFRRIGLSIPTLEQLNLPAVCAQLARKPRGLVLVTGPAGSGKSTTLAAMIEHLNQQEARVVVTIEDPIEYLYQDKRCVITQREVGADTHSFAAALRGALRQDVDVILVGEMRDPETMAACLTAAETGHLVLSTLHTKSAPLSVDRIVDVFPPHQQPQIRMQLSLTLEGALAQTLLPRLDQPGRIPAVEVMLASPAVRSLIREGKTHQLPNAIQTSAAEGMRTMEQALAELVRRGTLAAEQAWAAAIDPEALRSLLGGAA
jgi:twitching motility protein PilT